MKKANRLISFFLALLMAFGTIAITTVPAAAANPTTQSALQTALNAGGTVTLGSDITLTKPLTITKKSVTLNLNGKTISSRNTYAITVTSAKHITINGSGKVSGRGGIWLNNKDAGLFLNGGTIECLNRDNSDCYALCVSKGWAQLNGGTVYKNSSVKKGGTSLQIDKGAKVRLRGATVTGTGHSRSAYSAGELIVNKGNINGSYDALTVGGGSFTQTGGKIGAVHLLGGSVTISGGTSTIKETKRFRLSEGWRFENWSRTGLFMKNGDINWLAARATETFHNATVDTNKTNIQLTIKNSQKAKAKDYGHCYGMAATALLNKKSMIALTKRAGKASLNQIDRTEKIWSAIDYYRMNWDFSPLSVNNVSVNKNKALVNAVKAELVFACFWGKNGAHAIILTDVITGPNGCFRIIAYDVNCTSRRTYIDVSKDYKTITGSDLSCLGPKITGSAIVPASKMNAVFGWSDIDGSNNSQNLNPQSLSLQSTEGHFTTMSFPVGMSFTIENLEGQVLNYNGENDALTGNMAVIEYDTGKPQEFEENPGEVDIDNDILPGEFDPTEETEPEEIEEGEYSGLLSGIETKARFTIPASDGYSITTPTPGIDVTVITPDIFAAASSETADEVVVNKNAGVMISGGKSFDYEMSLGVNDSNLDLISMSGPTSYVASLLFKDGDCTASEIPVKCMGDFSQPDKTTLTIFTNTVEMHDYKVQANTTTLLLTGSTFGSSGEEVNGTLQLFGLNGDVEDQTTQINVEEIEPPHVHDYDVTGTEATCEEPGSLTFTCACGDTYTTEEEPLGHDTVFVSAPKPGNVIGHNHCIHCDYSEEVIEPANTDALADRLDVLEEVEQGNKTNASWAIFQNAKENAWDVLADIESTQGQLNAALKAVNDAYGNLQDNPPITKYVLTVNSGTGGGNFAQGATVTITANAAPSGKVFDKWTTSDGVTFANANNASTTFTMPAKNVTVTATYKDTPKGIFGTNPKWYGAWWHYLLFFLCFGFIWMWF